MNMATKRAPAQLHSLQARRRAKQSSYRRQIVRNRIVTAIGALLVIAGLVLLWSLEAHADCGSWTNGKCIACTVEVVK